jgi:peptidoglycan/xylan/chitin deacetylase (PgdA/CDA1 family)
MLLTDLLRGTEHSGVIINEHTLTSRQTRTHVEALSRWFDFIHHDDLLGRLAAPRGRPFCLLTFDDGKLNNATETAPELERLGVPAVFYVTTDFVDGRPLWFDRQDVLRNSLGYEPSGLEQESLKRLPFALLDGRLDRAFKQYGIVEGVGCEETRPMSWDDVRRLDSRGFTIGSHGLIHTLLTRETPEIALSHIEQSTARVSSEIGRRCVTFAFPNGNYTEQLARHALACGAETVMTTEPTWACRRFARWRLPRVQVYAEDSGARIELKLALAATARLLPNPDGTGRRYRAINRNIESEN